LFGRILTMKKNIKNGSRIILKNNDLVLSVDEFRLERYLVMSKPQTIDRANSLFYIENINSDSQVICDGDEVLLKSNNDLFVVESKGKLNALEPYTDNATIFIIAVEDGHGKPIIDDSEIALLKAELLPEQAYYLMVSEDNIVCNNKIKNRNHAIFNIIFDDSFSNNFASNNGKNKLTSQKISSNNKENNVQDKNIRTNEQTHDKTNHSLSNDKKTRTVRHDQKIAKDPDEASLVLTELDAQLYKQTIEMKQYHDKLLSLAVRCKNNADRFEFFKDDKERLIKLNKHKVELKNVLKTILDYDDDLNFTIQSEEKIFDHILKLKEELFLISDILSIKTQNTISQLDSVKEEIQITSGKLNTIKEKISENISKYKAVSGQLDLHINANKQIAGSMQHHNNSVKNILDEAKDLIVKSDSLLEDILKNNSSQGQPDKIYL